MNYVGKLKCVAGLPGSGKTYWRKKEEAKGALVIDDFMAHSLNDIGMFTYSRWYLPVVFALRAGRDVLLIDVTFCKTEFRQQTERVMTDAVKDIIIDWIFFNNDPSACRRNIEADSDRKDNKERLKKLEELSQSYDIPSGEIIQVYSP